MAVQQPVLALEPEASDVVACMASLWIMGVLGAFHGISGTGTRKLLWVQPDSEYFPPALPSFCTRTSIVRAHRGACTWEHLIAASC